MVFKNVLVFFKKNFKRLFSFIKSEKTFLKPKKAKILVFDREGLELLEPLFNGEVFEIFHTRGETFNLSLSVIVRLILHIFLKKTIRDSYFGAFMEQVDPSIVITYTDNSSYFQTLDKNNKNDRLIFITISNGTRSLHGTTEQLALLGPVPKTIYHSNFFCCGRNDVDEYTTQGAIVKKFYPYGSLIDSYYRSSHSGKNLKTSFNICLVVDPWYTIPLSDDCSVWGSMRPSYELLLSYLKLFQEHNACTIVAACKNLAGSDECQNEVKWLQVHLGSDVSYISRERNVLWSNYKLTDSAEVVIGMASALMKESFGRRKKVLQCNYSGDPLFDFPNEGIWLLKEKGYEIFEKRLLKILSMDTVEYEKICMNYPSYFIGYNEAKPTHTAITEFIEKHIQLIQA
jgi:surface carbohydrate biosynthesis protein